MEDVAECRRPDIGIVQDLGQVKTEYPLVIVPEVGRIVEQPAACVAPDIKS